MNEHLIVKAQELNSEKWVEGFYFENALHSKIKDSWGWIVPPDFELFTDTAGCVIESLTQTVPVNMETVCRFTGFRDSYGLKVWENSLIHCDIEGETYIVKWDDDQLCWTTYHFPLTGDSENIALSEYSSDKIEVVGDIYQGIY